MVFLDFTTPDNTIFETITIGTKIDSIFRKKINNSIIFYLISSLIIVNLFGSQFIKTKSFSSLSSNNQSRNLLNS